MLRHAQHGRAVATALHWITAFAVLLGVIGLGYLQLKDGSKPNGTTIALVAIAGVLVFGIVAPGTAVALLARVAKVKVGAFELSFTDEKNRAERVRHRLPELLDGVKLPPRPETGNPTVDALLVQAMARRRLRFLRDGVFKLEREFDYRDVLAHLADKRLLDADEAAVILDLLEEQVARWPESEREGFLKACWPFAYRLAALVWDRHVRHELEAADWDVMPVPQGRGHLPDFEAGRSGTAMIVAARVASPWRSLDKTRARLAKGGPDQRRPRVIVVPDKTDIEHDDRHRHVLIAKLKTVLAWDKVPSVEDRAKLRALR